jgi:hypothetical protein
MTVKAGHATWGDVLLYIRKVETKPKPAAVRFDNMVRKQHILVKVLFVASAGIAVLVLVWQVLDAARSYWGCERQLMRLHQFCIHANWIDLQMTRQAGGLFYGIFSVLGGLVVAFFIYLASLLD